MADSEKLTALKKAYADIILNTAKEAAERIMMSERKAQRCQQELVATKEESLRLLVRLKKILDSKVYEAEMTFLSQQKRIEELEAQLGEAEDIVKDLRLEFRELQDELEKLMNNHVEPVVEQDSKNSNATHLATEEDRVDASDAIMSPLPARQSNSATACTTHDSTLKGTVDEKLCMGNGCCRENGFASNSDFSSIVMRSKESELYRNGCTQRIRAFEQNQFGGNLPDGSDSVKSQKYTTEEQGDKHIDENAHILEKVSDEIRLTVVSGNLHPTPAVKSSCRKRKRGTRYKKLNPSSFKTYAARILDRYAKRDQDSGIMEDSVQEGLVDHLAPKSFSTTSKLTVPESSRSNPAYLRACSVQNVTKNESSINGLGNGKQIESAESLDFLSGVRDTDLAGSQQVISDQKDSVTTEASPTQSMNNRFIKYTFQRKRKRECPSSPDVGCSPDTSTFKRMLVEKQSDSLDAQNP